MRDDHPTEIVYLIDDDMPAAEAAAVLLLDSGVQARVFTSGAEAIERRETEPSAFCAAGFGVADGAGEEFVRAWVDAGAPGGGHPDAGFLALVDREEDGLAAVNAGADDFRLRPVGPEALAFAIDRVRRTRRAEIETETSRRVSDEGEAWERIIAGGTRTRDLVDRARKFSRTDATVLIVGETGTGKELLARAIHRGSRRGGDPFLVIDVSGIPEDRLAVELLGRGANGPTIVEQAGGGTLYLEGIDRMPASVQSQFAAWLKKAERAGGGARWIASSVTDPAERAHIGLFREDLLHLVQEVRLDVLPLRRRTEEIPILVRGFLDRLVPEGRGGDAATRSFDSGALEVLSTYRWPGNVGELEILVERIAVLSDGPTITAADLPALESPIDPDDGEPLESAPRTSDELKAVKKLVREKAVGRVERAFVLRALNRNGWNVTRAAKAVGMQRTNLQAMMRKYNVRRRR